MDAATSATVEPSASSFFEPSGSTMFISVPFLCRARTKRLHDRFAASAPCARLCDKTTKPPRCSRGGFDCIAKWLLHAVLGLSGARLPRLLLGRRLLRLLRSSAALLRGTTRARTTGNGRGAVRAHGPGGVERVVAGAAKVLETLVAVRAQHEVGFHRVAAVRALAVLHELALLQRDLQLLLVAVDLQQRRAQQAVRDDAEQRDERHDSPHVPVGTAQVRIAHHPDDGQHIQDDQQHHNHGERGLQFRSPQLVKQFAHFNLVFLYIQRLVHRYGKRAIHAHDQSL